MRNQAWHFLIALFFSVSLAAATEPQAQPSSPSLQQSLQSCYEAALKRSEVIGGQQELITQAEERARQALGSILPAVNATASRRWQETVQNSAGGAFYPSVQDQALVNLSQPLFRGLREFAALRQTRDLESSAQHSLRQAELLLYRDVAQAYYSVLSLERELINVGRELDLYARRVKELDERIRIGRSRVSEKITIQATEANLSAQAEALRGQIRVAREALAFQTGLAADIVLQEPTEYGGANSPESHLLALDAYLSHVQQRPDVLSVRAQESAAEEGIVIARGSHFPSLDLGANYYFARPGVLSNSNWDVSLLLSFPLYAGGTISSRVREAASQRRQVELNLGRTLRLADQEIRAFYATAEADLKQVSAFERAAKLSEKNYGEQTREYRLGLVTNLDVLQALAAFQQAQRSLDRARYAFKNDLERLNSAAALVAVKPAAAGSGG